MVFRDGLLASLEANTAPHPENHVVAEAALPPSRHMRLLLALALATASAVAACGPVMPAAAPPTYGSFKDSGGA